MSVPLLQVHQVSKKFNDDGTRAEVEALRDVSFTVEKGEFLSIIGPSGCGKSTLLRTIAGLTMPSVGKCLHKGELVTKPSLERGYVFQEPRLFPWLTVLQNISLGGGNGEELLKKMDLTGFGQAMPHELSGGMASRVALARALAPKPDLLLLDEPFANLDQKLRNKLKVELRKIWEQEGVTCIFVTHDLEEALELGTRLMVLSKRPGKILCDQLLDCEDQVDATRSHILTWMEG